MENAVNDANTTAGDPDCTVITALEAFILPIIRAQCPSLAADQTINGVTRRRINARLKCSTIDPDMIHGPHHRAEAQALLTSLKSFVSALLHPPMVGQGSIKPMEDDEENSTEDYESIVHQNQLITTVSIYRPLSRRPRAPLLQVAMDSMQHVIFNELPIRLLTFDGHGSGIALIERKDLWRRISVQMELDFEEHFVDPTNLEVPEWKDAKTEAVYLFNSRYWNFAILSHTWIQDAPGEVTYADWVAGTFDKNSLGYQKLVNFCKVAATEYGVTLGWMDTICINKESSSELDESIRSMFKWYTEASVCITYLRNTVTLTTMRNDPWFTRGWTLQELLAPEYMKFYNMQWEKINSNDSEHDLQNDFILGEICSATPITQELLRKPLNEISIGCKMQWAAGRKVTRTEDTAYSLMGIFGVSMSIAYGEGEERAFFRLVREILNSSKASHAMQILNFGYGYKCPTQSFQQISSSSLIPSSPHQYFFRSKLPFTYYFPNIPMTLTHLGLQVSVLLMPAQLVSDPSSSNEFTPIGNYSATVTDVKFTDPDDTISRWTYNLLDASLFEESGFRNAKNTNSGKILFFAVFNFQERPTVLQLPPENMCFSKPLIFRSFGRQQLDLATNFDQYLSVVLHPTILPTVHPIVFTLQPVGDSDLEIPKADLEKHGMYLRTLYI